MFSTRRAGTHFASWLALMASVSTACVLPPPGEELPGIDNRPPRIEKNIELSPPPEAQPIRLNPLCPARFVATVGDPDADTLHYRVFVDYYLQNTDDGRFTPVFDVPLDASVRRANIDFRPSGSLFGANRFGEGSPHLVELFVTDRPFRDGPSPQGRVVSEDAEFDTFVWAVVVDTTLNCEDVP